MKHLPLFLAAWCGVQLAAAVDYPGKEPGIAASQVTDDGHYTLSNDLFSATFAQQGGKIRFTGMKLADGTPVADSSPELFTVELQGDKTLKSSQMNVSAVSCKDLPANATSVRLAPRFPGKSLSATFTEPDSGLTVKWRAVLRDGSSYLRQEFTLSAAQDIAFRSITPLQYAIKPHGELSISGNTTHGRVVVNDLMFTALETPMGLMNIGAQEGGSAAAGWNPEQWAQEDFGNVFEIHPSVTKAYGNKYSKMDGPMAQHLLAAGGEVTFTQGGDCTITFAPGGQLRIIGVQLLSTDGTTVVSEDMHEGDHKTYTLKGVQAGEYTLRYWAQTKDGPVQGKGTVSISLPHQAAQAEGNHENGSAGLVTGQWVRATTLKPKHPWKVSSVLGIFAPEQKRRSFLYYTEREKAVPYRPFVHYNDWYEIGIRLHDNQDPAKRTNEAMWLELLKTWNRELYTKRGVRLDAFVIDDGWDEFNSLWDFHCGFPKGFSAINKQAKQQKAGIGTWLGPVGGYGSSKKMRLAFWNKNHPNNQINNFQLSNDEYFDAFTGRCKQMIKSYDMRYFKFDGISAIPHAYGPAKSPTGVEDAEGILRVLTELRQARPDIFINTTVGTWASPFWFMYADSIWRQENDFGRKGTAGDPRDQWITYRDRLVHEVFVTGAPLFPINSLMTHGIIITRNGPPKCMSTEPANCVKEIRAAFGCGSGLLEIYADQDLLNQGRGELWDELAAGIKWLRRNSDVLADTHWVGGNPWDGQDGDIYGWASWNAEKCTLTLRNSSGSEKTLRSTLRRILDIPPAYKGKVTLNDSYADQRKLSGLSGKAVDIDEEIDITLKPAEVLVYEGTNALSGGKKAEKADKKGKKGKKKAKKKD